jgi:hypothetical protein
MIRSRSLSRGTSLRRVPRDKAEAAANGTGGTLGTDGTPGGRVTLRRSLVEREMAKPHAESSDGETINILRQLVAEVRGLRADLARQHTGDLGGDDAQTANLLSAIGEAVGDRLFTSCELLEHAKVIAGPLCAVLDALNVATPRRLGKCLSRIEGRECAGLAVQRVGTDADGIIWKVVSMRV